MFPGSVLVGISHPVTVFPHMMKIILIYLFFFFQILGVGNVPTGFNIEEFRDFDKNNFYKYSVLLTVLPTVTIYFIEYTNFI